MSLDLAREPPPFGIMALGRLAESLPLNSPKICGMAGGRVDSLLSRVESLAGLIGRCAVDHLFQDQADGFRAVRPSGANTWTWLADFHWPPVL
ncbi:MAG: hypothetical protein ABSG98_12290 [Anaerolineales bacterium]